LTRAASHGFFHSASAPCLQAWRPNKPVPRFFPDDVPALECVDDEIDVQQNFRRVPFASGVVICFVSMMVRLSKGVRNVAEMEGDSLFGTFWRLCLQVVVEFRDFLVGCLLHRTMIENASESGA
ncbi:MAG: hypothetical protein ABSH09_22885, partial [Bryobacteraceae bacterium]